MSSAGFDEDLVLSQEGDWLERQFFSQARMHHHDLDWGPMAPLPVGARRAMPAALGMFTIALVGVVAFVVYASLVMRTPAPIGSGGALPPSAASSTRP